MPSPASASRPRWTRRAASSYGTPSATSARPPRPPRSFATSPTPSATPARWRKAVAQIERELSLIRKLGLAGYFLIVHDLVQFCARENVLVQGRGSAANSAVCYSLGITAVDPVGMGLLFERFLSEERTDVRGQKCWPDIDLDLPSGDQREKVIQHVYQRFGKAGAAMTANVITYRARATIAACSSSSPCAARSRGCRVTWGSTRAAW